jgi:hypothetical protein
MIGANKEATDNKVITREVTKLYMKEMFEHWIKNNMTYLDEEEKAMQFKLFSKATIEWIKS